jgi:membrane associated rhomboid family serine protease
MVEYSQSSTDSSIESNINIRRIAPRFEIISEINSDYSEPSYSPNSYYSNSPISSLGSNSPIRRLPTARYIPETYIDVEAQLVENDSLDRTISSQASSSIYSFFDEDNKPYLYRYIILIIWLSYLFGVLIMEKPKFNTISPANPKLYFQIISNYPNCKDTRGEIWRFFTSSLVHADIGHIIINTIILYPVMYFTELLNGRKSVITLLFLVSFYTNLIYSYLHPYGKTIGCSHIVFGFTGSLLSEFIINRNYLGYDISRIIIIYLLLSIFLELISYLLLFSSNTAYEAHWIGFIIGFISGLIIFKDKRTRTFNIKWLIIGSNLLSYLTTFFLYSFITNWPPEINSFLSNTDLPFCCYEKLVNNVTDISCYT